MTRAARLAFLLIAAMPLPAVAQDAEPPLDTAEPAFEPAGGSAGAFDLQVEAELLSDYRFRGISRSDEDPAVRGGLVVSHMSGAYAGVRGTSLAGTDGWRARDPGFVDLGDAQIDLFAGYRHDLGGGWDVDAGMVYYVFAGGRGATDYAEPYAALSYLIGPVYATAGAKYAPAQAAIGDEDMLYLFGQADVSVPLTPLSFTVQAGRQDWGRFGGYWNWTIGARYAVGPAEFGIFYVDTDLPSAPGQDGGLVLSVGLRF